MINLSMINCTINLYFLQLQLLSLFIKLVPICNVYEHKYSTSYNLSSRIGCSSCMLNSVLTISLQNCNQNADNCIVLLIIIRACRHLSAPIFVLHF